MKKKIMLSLAAVAMVGTLAVGGTLAWFTDTETATNVITTGHVDVKITENVPTEEQQNAGGYTVDKNSNSETGVLYGGIEPGTTIDKNPTITYEGNAPAYIRYKVSVTTDEDSELTAEDIQFVRNDGKPVEFVLGEYEYSAKIYETDDKVGDGTLFDKVVFSDECGNEIADSKLTITIVADAIQADNVSDVEITDANAETVLADLFSDVEEKNSGKIPEYVKPEQQQ